MNAPEEDAQRTMEQKALRNVRGLVDKLEDAEQRERRVQRRLLTWIAVGIAVVAVGFVALFAARKDPQSVTVRPPASQAPAR